MAKVTGKAVGGRVRIEVDLSNRDLKGFCATGDGGGIDNSCGREGGGARRESYNDRIEGTQAEADREVKRATAKVRKIKKKLSSIQASAAASRKVDIAKRTVDILQDKLDAVRARKEEIAAKLAELRANRKKSTEAELETALAAVAKEAAEISRQCDKLLADLETKSFCPNGPGGGIDPTCSPRSSAHDDSGGGGPGYKQTMEGEFWLDGGSSTFADGDLGDQNHEGLAIERAQRNVVEAAGDEYSEFAGDDFPDWDGFKAKFEKDHPELTEAMTAENTQDLSGLQELGINAEEWLMADGFGDPRAYAVENWGWVRVAGNNVQMNTISKSEMKSLADGLADAYEQQASFEDELGIDDDGIGLNRQSFNIETKRDFYEDVPFPVLESGDMGELRQYKRPGVSGWGGGKSAEDRGILATKVFCPTGPGGGVDPTCSPGGRRGSGGGDGPSSPTGPATDPTTPCPEAPCYEPNVYHDSNGDGVTEAARVGVPAHMMPPPPPIPRLKNLTAEEREAETKFAEAFERDPEGMTAKFLALVEPKEGPPVFETDMAKLLSEDWNDKDPQIQMAKRHTYNTPLHQTANAIAKRAFVEHLDTLPPGANVLVTVGGCGAGKGYALSKTAEGAELKSKAAVVWDSAGDQNATENGWVLKEARARGLNVTYAYVHNDPEVSWAHPERGVVQRATDPKNGRMVDAAVFADSYAIGARNHAAFHANHANVKDVKFVFVRNGKTPEAIPGVPPEAFVDRDRLYEFAKRTVKERTDLPATIKRGALVGERIWGEKL